MVKDSMVRTPLTAQGHSSVSGGGTKISTNHTVWQKKIIHTYIHIVIKVHECILKLEIM